jgi:RecA-family ATPase
MKTITAQELAAIEFPPRRWAVPALVTEGLTILAGRPKTGKSWLGLNLAVAVATGGVALGKIEVDQGEVLYLALEDGPRRVQERLIKIVPFGDLPNGLHIATAGDFPPLHKGGLPALEDWLKEHPEARLVIIDTLARVKPGKGRNQDSYEHDTAVIAALQKLSIDHGTAIVVLHHTRKTLAEDFLEEVSGTYGLTGAADCVAVLARKERGEMDGTLKLTGRDIEEQALALRFSPDLGHWELLGEVREFTRSKERTDIILILKEHGPLSPKEIAEILEKKPGAIRKLLWKMKNSQEIRQLDNEKYDLVVTA